jgi:glycosyltransferase involved in cell wall biosynthesis
MKVLVVSDGILPPVVYSSGMTIIYDIQKVLKELGVDLHILTCYYHWASPNWREWIVTEEKSNGIPIHYLYLNKGERLPRQSFWVSRGGYFFKALKLHFQYDFDIIHEYSSSPLLLWRTSLYKLLSNVHVVHTLSTLNLGLSGSPKFSCGMHFVDKVICTNKYMEEQMLRFRNYRKRVMYLPLGVDISRFSIPKFNREDLLARLDIPFDVPVVLYVGPFEFRKGFFLLLEAARIILKKFPNTFFVLVSPGSRDSLHESFYVDYEMIWKLIAEYEKSFRIVKGVEDIPSFMNMADIFVLPQITAHGTLGHPLTLLEAMVCGKAIVASNTPGVSDLISHGHNGLLFSSGNASELAENIISLISSPKKRVLGENAKETVKAYDVRLIARELKEVYEDILST